MTEKCEKSGLYRWPVPGGWIYEIPFQYDMNDIGDSVVGVNHVFVPLYVAYQSVKVPE